MNSSFYNKKHNSNASEEKRKNTLGRPRRFYNTMLSSGRRDTRGYSFNASNKNLTSGQIVEELFFEIKKIIEKIDFPSYLEYHLNFKISNGVFNKMNQILTTRNLEFTTDSKNDNYNVDYTKTKLDEELTQIRNFNKEVIYVFVISMFVFFILLVFILIFTK